MKCPIGKPIFAVNLSSILFCAAVANADTWSLKSLYTYIIWYVLGPHAGEILTKSYGPKWSKFWVFSQDTEFLKTISDKELAALLQDVYAAETIV